MATLQIVETPEGLALIFPDEILTDLNLKVGDEIEVTTTPAGIHLAASRRVRRLVDKTIKDHSATLKRLADQDPSA